MKVALVCDWLTNVGGAEKVLLEFHKLYPKAPIYTSKYDPRGIDWFKSADIRTGWLQVFPTCFRRVLGPFRQCYFSHLNLSEYDLIISVTGAEAKSVKSGKWLHEKGKKSANPNGLYDIYGNVYELCLDWFATGADLSDGTPQTDPKGPVSGTTRVMRGGGYNGSYSDQSSIGKSSIYPSTQNFATVGLRLACDADFTAFGE